MTRANATSVQVLHLLWPDRNAPTGSALSSFSSLEHSDFPGPKTGDNAELDPGTIERIAIEVESLRARALAARHRFLVDAFCDEAKRLGIDVDVQPTRQVVFRGEKNHGAVMPLVGVPSAERMHEAYRALMEDGVAPDIVWALYDNRGMLRTTIDHLDWLNASLPLKAISVYEVSMQLGKEAAI